MEADEKRAQPAPLKFAEPFECNVSPQTHGAWSVLPDGTELWRFAVQAPGSTDLNFGFDQYRLPTGAALYVTSSADNYYQGPYTERDNKDHGEFWTPMVPGDQATIELYLPPDRSGETELLLTFINRGYRDFFKTGVLAKQGLCNNDVICPEGDPWRDEIRAVGVYTLNGSWTCTGTMIMDAQSSFRNFFLTANHCEISTANDQSIVVYWNFDSPVCMQLGGGSLSDNQSGATLRASKSDVDMALIELDDDPDPSFNVHYAGWDRSGTAPQAAVGIHHPSADEKAISFDNDPLNTVDSCIGTGGTNTHWQVGAWEDGTTESGSSGSGIWDAHTHLLVGFLSGGSASCENPAGTDCYGKFSAAWDSGEFSFCRLRDWLDPYNSGVTSVAGNDCNMRVVKTAYTGHDNGASCPGSSYLTETNNGPITYCFEVMNASTQTISNVNLIDPQLGYSNHVGSLASGQSVTQYLEVTMGATLVNTAVAVGVVSQMTVTNYGSMEVISILPKPLLTFPVGGELLPTGTMVYVTWNTNGATSPVRTLMQVKQGEETFTDDMESGTNGWLVSHCEGSSNWTQDSLDSHSPSVSWLAEDIASVSDQYLVSPALALGAGAVFSFWHSYDLEEDEEDETVGYDGGVIEISTAGPSGPWSDLGPMITENRYDKTISRDHSSPIGGREAFTGDSGGWIQTVVDLSSYAGDTVHLRFREANDRSVSKTGWRVDDVQVTQVIPWVTVSLSAVGATSNLWVTPAGMGTNFQLRVRHFADGFVESEWFTSAALILTNSPDMDSDSDGIPNTWEAKNGLNPFSFNSPTNDLDRDSVTDLDEYYADTAANNSNDFFEATGIVIQNSPEVFFHSSTARVYTLQYLENMHRDSWSNVLGAIDQPGSGRDDRLSDTNALPFFRAYRIRVRLPD